jgi:sugar O-acyltransferase (sialic acid O-acetyltransferase NeuD family)
MNNIYLVGASGHSKVIAGILESENRMVLRVFDRDGSVKQMLHLEVKQQPAPDEWPADGSYIIAIGINKTRQQIAESNKMLCFTKAIHPKATISAYASIKEGTVVMAGATINVDTSIGKHVILNTNCSIDHDCIIEDYVHISPNVALGGNVHVGEGTHIGIGAAVIQGIKIGKWATIGAGAVIIKDVPDYAVVVGNPGKIIKYNPI